MEKNKIKFRSPLEKFCYEKLLANNINAKYEPESYTLLESFNAKNVRMYFPKKDQEHYKATGRRRFNLLPYNSKIRSISYTPDFLAKINNHIIFIEVKGRINDAYPLRKKLFIKYLENWANSPIRKKYTFWFFEPHTQEHVCQMINVLNDLKKDKNGNI